MNVAESISDGPASGDWLSDSEVVEMSLLLPTWQVAALETAAHTQGLTTGQMLRRVIRQFFGHVPVEKLN